MAMAVQERAGREMLSVLDAKSENLFINKSIDDIKVESRQTKQDIENKKEELRQMVGERYRDLIDAADTIMTMASSAAELNVDARAQVAGSIGQMQELCSTLQHGGSSFLQRDRKDANRIANPKFYHVAMQMKLLMDAPEQVWSALEQNQYCRAAQLYILARTTYSQLKSDPDKETRRLLKSFPIMARQWTSISPFKEVRRNRCRAIITIQHSYEVLSILAGASSVLRDNAADPVIARALSAVMLLEDISFDEACTAFLDARRSALSDLMNHDLSSTTVKQQVSELVALVVATIKQLYSLFFPRSGEDADGQNTQCGCLYEFIDNITTGACGKRLSERSSHRDDARITFESMPGTTELFTPKLQAAGKPMSLAVLKTACVGWIDAVTQLARESCGKILRHVMSVAGIAEVRDAVWELLRDEFAAMDVFMQQVGSVADDVEDFQRTPLATLTQLVAGIDFDPWALFLQPTFLQRAQAILTGLFRGISDDLKPLIKEVGATIVGSEGGASDSDLAALLWRTGGAEQINFARQKGFRHWETLPFFKSLSMCAGGFSAEVMSVVDHITDRLQTILDESQCLLGDDTDGESRSRRPLLSSEPGSSVSTLGSILPFKKYGDAIEVRRFLQAACEKFVVDLVKWVARERSSIAIGLEFATPGSPQDARIDQVLFLGRLCKAIAEKCPALETLVLLPSVAVRSKRGGRLNVKVQRRPGPRSRAPVTEHERRVNELKAKLMVEYDECYASWVGQLEAGHGSQFKVGLRCQDWGDMHLQKQVWQQHKVVEESEAGEKVQSQLSLPGQPSGFVVRFLCSVSTDLNAAGGHTIARKIIVALVDRLLGSVYDGYDGLLDGSGAAGSTVSQDGLVQILFDLQFVTDIFLGSEPTTSNPTLHARGRALIERVKGLIDPFDLDVFTPFLQASQAKAYHRSSVLFGFFSHINAAHTGSRPLLSSSENHNMVCRC